MVALKSGQSTTSKKTPGPEPQTLNHRHTHQEAFVHLVRSIGLPEDKNKVAPMFASSEYDTLIRTLHHIGMLLEEAGMPIDAARAIILVNRLDHREIKYNPYLVSALISAGILPSTLNPQPSALSPQHSLGKKPSALNPQPSTLSPQPSALSPQPSTLNPKPYAAT